MARNEGFSEFSYGYALTEEIVSASPGLQGAPIFPSLLSEGQTGGGFDVRIDRGAVPLFLQFKMSQYLRRASANERKRYRLFNGPFYRMHLRRRDRSRQHELLLELERTYPQVYYVAPAFHTTDKLNDYYLRRRIVSHSAFVRPSDLGPLVDDQQHHVAFENTQVGYFFSEPKKIGDISSKRFVASLTALALKNTAKSFSDSTMWPLLAKLESFAREVLPKTGPIRSLILQGLG